MKHPSHYDTCECGEEKAKRSKTCVPCFRRSQGTFEERLFAKIAKSEGCWEWTGALQTNGYGYIKGPQGSSPRMLLAHRAVYELRVAAILPGQHIDHLCRNTRCVNPDHLEAVTPLENTHRSIKSLGRTILKPGGTCKRGHVLVEGNYYCTALGYYRCRECSLAYFLARRSGLTAAA